MENRLLNLFPPAIYFLYIFRFGIQKLIGEKISFNHYHKLLIHTCIYHLLQFVLLLDEIKLIIKKYVIT